MNKSGESNNDDLAEHAIKTTTNHMYSQDTSIRGQIFQDYDSILINEI